MLSFLPKKEKEEILKEYRSRAVTAALMFTSFLAIIALVGLLPSYLSEKVQKDAVVRQTAALASAGSGAEQEDKREVANKAVAKYLEKRIGELNASTAPSEAVTEAIENKPNTVAIQSIKLSKQNMTIGGVADTRNDLISFQRSLQKGGFFKEVTLPISNITKSTDADFVLELSMP